MTEDRICRGGVLLSVIIPVYNTEKFLPCCLDSVINQNFKEGELEIICVDDGSSDNSLAVIKQYEKRYSFVKVISQTNCGVSSARNNGLKHATGKYICFLDSDDYIIKNSYSQCVKIMGKENAQSACFLYRQVDEAAAFDDEMIDVTYHRESKQMFSSSNVVNVIILRKTIVENKIYFNEKMCYGEDTLFMYFLSREINVSKHLYFDAEIYCYRQRAGSLMHSKSSNDIKRHMDNMLEMAKVYSNALESDDLSDSFFENTKARLDKAIMAAMFDAVRIENINISCFIDELKHENLYPKNFAWWTLKTNNIKTLRYNLLCFLFPIPLYYKTFAIVYRKILHIK